MHCWKENEIKKWCINQLNRSKVKLPEYMQPEGIGDCTICMPCADNIHCSYYIPISLTIMEIK